MMKMAEAVASYMAKMIKENIKSNPITMMGGLLARPAFDRVKKVLDPDEVGGHLFLGVNGVVIIGHGRSGAIAIMRAVEQARHVAERKSSTPLRLASGKKAKTEWKNLLTKEGVPG